MKSMKKYVFIGMVLLLVNGQASDNPFDLKENFGKLERDQERLLSGLKEIGARQELAQTLELNAKASKEVEAKEEIIELPRQELPVIEIGNIVTSSEEESQKEEARKTLEAKKEAEKREVEAYEKKRAKRLAKKEAEAKILEEEALVEKKALAEKEALAEKKALAGKEALDKKEALAKKEAEEKVLASQKAEALKKQKLEKEAEIQEEKIKKIKTRQASQDKVIADTNTVSPRDVNVTRDKEEAKIVADKAYEEAVREMSQED